MKVKIRVDRRKPTEILRDALRAAPRAKEEPRIRFSIRDLRVIKRALAAYPAVGSDEHLYFFFLQVRLWVAIERALEIKKAAKNEGFRGSFYLCRPG